MNIKSIKSHYPVQLIATLGTEPQVVTAVIDLLAVQGESIDHVVVLHSVSVNSALSVAVDTIESVLSSEPYNRRFTHELVPLIDALGNPLADVETLDSVQEAFRTLYRCTWEAKRNGFKLHLSIAGGRKSLSIYGMVVAQLLFDDHDSLWHLYSGGEFLQSRRLHPQAGDDVHLVPIPVLLREVISPALTHLQNSPDPIQALEYVNSRDVELKTRKARDFIQQCLTAGERRIVSRLVHEGLSDADIAACLSISPRTVEQHLRSAFRKAADAWQLESVNRAQLITLLHYELDWGGTQE